MEPVSRTIRLVRQAYWLIKLRWIAVTGTFLTIFLSHNILKIPIQHTHLYYVTGLLLFHNIISFLLLKKTAKAGEDKRFSLIKRAINFQISVDLLILTALLHYSGGIENPFIVYFVFHMVISSILLSVRESYFQATFAAGLLTFLALLEYKMVIPHYCIGGLVAYDLHNNVPYIFGMMLVIVSTLYITVYMTSSISTQLRKQEEAYRQANEQLKQKDRIKDEYVSRVTHDIKGHLAAIQSCLDVVKNGLVGSLNEKQSNFVGRAHARTSKLAGFVRTLLKLTQMRLSDKLVMDEFPLKDTIHDAVDAVRSRAEEKSITLNCEIEPSISEIYGNQFSIEEVITNLLLNAIKYTPEKGTVGLKAIDNCADVRIEIADTGIGIPQKDIDKVFDEFFRSANAKKLVKDGSGLGLSIAKQIIQRHQGQIGVESKENEGAMFWFTLPKHLSDYKIG